MQALDQILTAAEMRAAEEQLIAAGTGVETLMERAGAGAADWVFRIAAGRPVTVLCGPGNNGGDGYVIARVLQERGLNVSVVAPIEPKTDAARTARSRWGGETVADAKGGVFVDCLFGTGLARPLEDEHLALLARLAGNHTTRIAIDLPSGVDSDSGELLNDGLPQFDCTVALGAWKFAHWLMPSMECVGTTRLVDIGIGAVEDAARLSQRPVLPRPDRDAHKYSRGMLVVIGGSMPGASVLAARAASRGGAGYVKLFATEEVSAAPADLVVERDFLFDLLTDRRLCAALIGPGLGRDAEARAMLAETLHCDSPTVCDADALHLLEPAMLDDRSAPLIVTPHAGELDALSNVFGTVGLDRVEQVCELAEALDAVVVAKGPDTMIAAPSEPVTIMPPASPWLSTAGTGDVLAGLIASQLAVGRNGPAMVAQDGLWLHREAAHLAGPAFSACGLVDCIPAAYRAFL